jgi:hypothetical protein
MAKKQPIPNLNLFAPKEEPAALSSTPVEPPPPKIKDACPRCGSKALKTVRPHEHEGKQWYCAGGCLSEDRTDGYYFDLPGEVPF